MSEMRKVAEFIGEQLARVDLVDTGERLSKLICVHIVKGNKIGDEVRIVSVPDDDPDEQWIDQTARKLVTAASEEAEQLGTGLQRYAIQAWFGAEEKPRARVVIVCRGADDDESIGTEGPDGEGLVAQAMRHTEFFAQSGYRERAQIVKDLQEDNQRLRKENEGLRADYIRSLSKVREIYLADAERALELRRQDSKDKMISTSVERLQTFGMHALNYWSLKQTGKPMFPEVAAAMVEAKTFADSLTDADIEKLQGVLGVEKTAHLVQFAQAVSHMPPPDEAGKALQPAAPNGVATR